MDIAWVLGCLGHPYPKPLGNGIKKTPQLTCTLFLFLLQPAEKQLAATTTDLATNNPMRLLPIVAVLIAIVLLLVILAVIFVIIIRGRNGCANTGPFINDIISFYPSPNDLSNFQNKLPFLTKSFTLIVRSTFLRHDWQFTHLHIIQHSISDTTLNENSNLKKQLS